MDGARRPLVHVRRHRPGAQRRVGRFLRAVQVGPAHRRRTHRDVEGSGLRHWRSRLRRSGGGGRARGVDLALPAGTARRQRRQRPTRGACEQRALHERELVDPTAGRRRGVLRVGSELAALALEAAGRERGPRRRRGGEQVGREEVGHRRAARARRGAEARRAIQRPRGAVCELAHASCAATAVKCAGLGNIFGSVPLLVAPPDLHGELRDVHYGAGCKVDGAGSIPTLAAAQGRLAGAAVAAVRPQDPPRRFQDCGSDISWLEIFPGEKEIFFLAVAFLKPTGRTEVVEGNTFVEVALTVESNVEHDPSRDAHLLPDSALIFADGCDGQRRFTPTATRSALASPASASRRCRPSSTRSRPTSTPRRRARTPCPRRPSDPRRALVGAAAGRSGARRRARQWRAALGGGRVVRSAAWTPPPKAACAPCGLRVAARGWLVEVETPARNLSVAAACASALPPDGRATRLLDATWLEAAAARRPPPRPTPPPRTRRRPPGSRGRCTAPSWTWKTAARTTRRRRGARWRCSRCRRPPLRTCAASRSSSAS